jgi:hypothetical protein
MTEEYFEEEEFDTQFNGQTVVRILKQGLPHWPYMVVFLVSVSLVSATDSYFTYLNKRIIDEGIIPGNMDMLVRLMVQYGVLPQPFFDLVEFDLECPHSS